MPPHFWRTEGEHNKCLGNARLHQFRCNPVFGVVFFNPNLAGYDIDVNERKMYALAGIPAEGTRA
jgi:hypothetical protein